MRVLPALRVSAMVLALVRCGLPVNARKQAAFARRNPLCYSRGASITSTNLNSFGSTACFPDGKKSHLLRLGMLKQERLPLESSSTSTSTQQLFRFSAKRKLSASETVEYVTASLRDLLAVPSLVPPVPVDVGIESEGYFPVYNPAGSLPLRNGDGSLVHLVRDMNLSDASIVVELAHDSLSDWRDGRTAAERSRILQTWSRLLNDHANDIAIIMTLESGKPLQESRNEIKYGISFIDYYAAEALRPTGPGGGFLVPTPFADANTGGPRGSLLVRQQAVGVAAFITPWNFPFAMVGSCPRSGSSLAGCFFERVADFSLATR
jgi:Aldehyde dehydrogenase family